MARRRAEVERLGVRVVWETKAERAAAFHIHPADIGGAIVSFDQMWPPESWQWAGPGWEERRAANASAIIAVDIQSPDPAAMAARWSQVFGRPVAGNTLQLESGSIRFVVDQDGRGPGVAAIDLAARNANACGRFGTTMSVWLPPATSM